MACDCICRKHIFQYWLLLLKVFVTSGLGGMSGAQAKAAVIAGCIGVVAEVWDMHQDLPVSKCYTDLSLFFLLLYMLPLYATLDKKIIMTLTITCEIDNS